MNTFRVTLHLRSAVASAWQSDTIFGHLCWAKRYLDGESALLEFLEWYGKDVGEPPILVSDGFPGDLLPRPLTPPEAEPQGQTKAEQMKAYDERKDTKKVSFLSLEEFNRAINGETVTLESKEFKPKKHVTLKNQIDRLTGTTGGGGQLFEFKETYWGETPVSIYVRAEKGFEDEIERLFRFVAEQGYGKRKSVGYGAIESMDFEPFDGFHLPANPNGFVSLSGFVPANADPTSGFWKTMVKYGKLGEEFASGENPFKKPLIMLTAGSVFFDDSPREWYGRLVPKVANIKEPDIVQYGFALPIPMIVPS